MKKIPTMFIRDEATHLVTSEPNPACAWVFAGEGVATRKLDGTSCLWKDGRLWKRYELRLCAQDGMVTVFAGPGPQVNILGWRPKTPYPTEFVPAQSDAEPVTKHGERKLPGWVPVGDGPDDRWHREARVAVAEDEMLFPIDYKFESEPGTNIHEEGLTMELVGPKINGNPERLESHLLFYHAGLWLDGSKDPYSILPCLKLPAERELGSLRDFLAANPMEGLVFHRGLDGQMAKIKRKDLGLPWPVKP